MNNTKGNINNISINLRSVIAELSVGIALNEERNFPIPLHSFTESFIGHIGLSAYDFTSNTADGLERTCNLQREIVRSLGNSGRYAIEYDQSYESMVIKRKLTNGEGTVNPSVIDSNVNIADLDVNNLYPYPAPSPYPASPKVVSIEELSPEFIAFAERTYEYVNGKIYLRYTSAGKLNMMTTLDELLEQFLFLNMKEKNVTYDISKAFEQFMKYFGFKKTVCTGLSNYLGRDGKDKFSRKKVGETRLSTTILTRLV